jgi:class 3 adenylate cyclase
MKIKDLYSKYTAIYAGSSFMVQQKAFVLLMGCLILLPVPFVFTIINMTDPNWLRADTVFNILSMFIIAICVALLWKGKFRHAVYLITSFLITGACIIFISKIEQYQQSGLNNVLFQMFAFLTLSFLFDSKKLLVAMASVFLCCNATLFIMSLDSFNPAINRFYIYYNFTDSNVMLVLESVILFLSITISNRAFGRLESELERNQELTNTLEVKVEERTRELKEANETLAGIGENLRKYLPIQLVASIISGSSDAVLESERKKLTIFFSDIKGFTDTTDALEAEELTSLLNEYLDEMTGIADRFGGTVDKFIGDAVMIFFGAPESRGAGEDALNCVKMAIAMQRRMKELKKKWFDEGIEHPLEIRIGINTGTATVGNFGASERLSYTVIGGQVNLASRLESICKPGGILISHQTYALVRDEIECGEGRMVTVKGIPREVTVYDVKI